MAKDSKDAGGIKIVAQNRRARHDFEIVKTFECGLELKGAEVKSLREGKAQMREAFARVDSNELWVMQLHIPPWTHASQWSKMDPDRRRKLLVHGREIDEMREATQQKGLTLVPLAIYFKDGRAKLELAVARGRKTYDKRNAMAQRDANRDIEREVSARNKG
jgi:SsrA-binding protein